MIVNWVRVADRLPDIDGPILVFTPTADPESPNVMLGWYDPKYKNQVNDTGWSLLPPYWIPHITHWMFLPDWPEDYDVEKERKEAESVVA